MQTHIKDNWLSCYLYYEGAADTFLADDVWPFVRQAIEARQVAAFFFIRYRDNRGQHIRLRLKNGETITRARLKDLLASRFDSIRFVRYAPEIQRYGGQKGIEVAEQLFQASSVAALTRISEAAAWDYNLAIGSALQSHLGMAYALGMGRQEAANLFAHEVGSSYQNNKVKPTDLLKALDEQSARIVPQVSALWDACEKGIGLNAPWFSRWQDETRAVGQKLRKLRATDQLNIPHIASHEPNQLWYLYESYIHMTNNRFGLTNQDEVLVAYIIKEALKDHE